MVYDLKSLQEVLYKYIILNYLRKIFKSLMLILSAETSFTTIRTPQPLSCSICLILFELGECSQESIKLERMFGGHILPYFILRGHIYTPWWISIQLVYL